MLAPKATKTRSAFTERVTLDYVLRGKHLQISVDRRPRHPAVALSEASVQTAKSR